MFEIFFGSIWTIVMIIFTYVFYGNTGGTITVNGQVVSQAEFNAMLGPKIFIAIFWAIGIFILYKGIMKLKRNRDTELNGEICYGRVTDVYPSGAYINNRPLYKIDVKLYIPSIGDTKMISEDIGSDRYFYPANSYVEAKYYNDDINIERIIEPEDIPEIAANFILTEAVEIDASDTVTIDGVEYIRKDSIDDTYKY